MSGLDVGYNVEGAVFEGEFLGIPLQKTDPRIAVILLTEANGRRRQVQAGDTLCFKKLIDHGDSSTSATTDVKYSTIGEVTVANHFEHEFDRVFIDVIIWQLDSCILGILIRNIPIVQKERELSKLRRIELLAHRVVKALIGIL